MTITDFWGPSIPAQWYSSRAALPTLLLLALPCFAAAADPALARLGQGIGASAIRDFPGTVQRLQGLPAQLPRLSDYASYYLAAAEMQMNDSAGAARDLGAYRNSPVASSPLAGKIVLLYARALLAQRQPTANSKALESLQGAFKSLPQPDGDFALALAYEAQGEKLQAALAYARVYYAYPNTDMAAQSWTALERLRPLLGREFPAALPKQQLERCLKWLDAKEFGKARQEYAALAATLPEPDRDEARVGIGVADYLGGDAAAALRYLTALRTGRTEADARRLYYVMEAARKTGDDAAMMDAVKQLGQHHAESAWRLKALISAGNRYLATNDPAKYTPLFRAASDTFPSDGSTAYSHWKVVWDAWLADKPERYELLREQIERYPSDSRTSSALYFLGRLQEKTGRYEEARACYDRAVARFPHYFYSTLSRDRLRESKAGTAAPDPATVAWLDAVDWPAHRDFTATEANNATRQRIDRSRLLMLAGLPELADAELRFGAKQESEQPHLLAMELARSMPSPFQALRIMKSFITDYLAIPFEDAPLKFWQLLFPLPYREDVLRGAKAHDLDPYSVAALIRQETEFNPSAISHANAYGLMQLIPATGKLMGKQQGIAVTGTGTLLDPAINIQLGTHYLRAQLNGWDGNWAETLAAYNAGPGRVRQWLALGTYREQAEFVESIPFNETREYVQAVLRNADMYRTLYGERHAAAPEMKEVSDVPPVTLAALPNAARTPGGGVRTAIAGRKTTAPASKNNTAVKKTATTKKATAASAKRPAVHKKKQPA